MFHKSEVTGIWKEMDFFYFRNSSLQALSLFAPTSFLAPLVTPNIFCLQAFGQQQQRETRH